jgi:uncharacterized membrane protein YtjA (UPF0391 family)
MLKWAVIFLVVSLVAGALGLTPVARGARMISLILFGVFAIFMVLVVIIVVMALAAGDALF